MLQTRPFVEATKQTTPVALLGGGDAVVGPRPGLVSLAHKGVMLADKFFAWPRAAAEYLRIPLQDKRVSLARRDWQYAFPADSQLIATANPCPCGNWGHPNATCRCTRWQRKRYLDRISGPIFDRIDIRV
jgi:magnesium chelatase family protein